MNKILFAILLISTFNISLAENLGWDYVPSNIGARYTYIDKVKSGEQSQTNKSIEYIVNCKNNQKNCVKEVNLSKYNKNNILYTSSKLTLTNKGVKSIEDTSNSSFKYSDGIYLPKKIVFDKPIKSESSFKTKKSNIKYQETDKYHKIKYIKINNEIYKDCIVKYVTSSSSNEMKSSSKITYCKNIGLVQAKHTGYFKILIKLIQQLS